MFLATLARHDKAAWEELVEDLHDDEIEWLGTFRTTRKGNLTRTGYLADDKTDNGRTFPFRINVFKTLHPPEAFTPWTWGLVVNNGDSDEQPQVYSNEYYPNPFLAAIDARERIERDFTIDNGDNLTKNIRAAFQKAASIPAGAYMDTDVLVGVVRHLVGHQRR